MPDPVLLLLQIAVIIATARVFGLAFRAIRQPPVVGEMVAGIVLGPSLFGWLAPELSARLFPAASLGFLEVLSQVGLVLFMFVTGLHLHPSELKRNSRAAVFISNASVLLPLILGALLAVYLHPRVSQPSVPPLAFSLFMGAAMSITAMPVLARILADWKLTATPLGTLAITCAAVNDVAGWCLLAVVVGLLQASQAPSGAALMVLGAAAHMGVMLWLVRPLLRRLEQRFERSGRLGENVFALILFVAFASALVTQAIGIHLLFGAFLSGVIMPKGAKFVRSLTDRIQPVTTVVLLPLFFALTGLRTELPLLDGPGMWQLAILAILVAVAGKLGGTLLAARLAGTPWRESSALGILMNTRGLMELVILSIGLDIGAISPAVYSVMVLMALVTTLMTAPLLGWVYPAAAAAAAQARPQTAALRV